MPIDKAHLDGILVIQNRLRGTGDIIPISSGRALSAGDMGGYLRANGTSAVDVSIPSCSEVGLPIGSFFTLRQAGSGQITFVAGSGVSIAIRTSGSLMTNYVGARVTLTKVGADTWDLDGDVSGEASAS